MAAAERAAIEMLYLSFNKKEVEETFGLKDYNVYKIRSFDWQWAMETLVQVAKAYD